MPTYQVVDPNTNKKLRITGDTPPSEAELERIFSQIQPASKIASNLDESISQLGLGDDARIIGSQEHRQALNKLEADQESLKSFQNVAEFGEAGRQQLPPNLRSQFDALVKSGKIQLSDNPKPLSNLLPDVFSSNVLEGQDASKVALFGGIASLTPDQGDLAKIAKNIFPDLSITQDSENVVLESPSGQKAVLNKPGFSPTDAAQLMGLTGAFMPAGGAGSLAAKTAAKGLAVGGAAGGTQAGIDLAQQAAGRDESVSVSNIRGGDVALAAGAGTLFELLFQGLGRMVPIFRQRMQSEGVTEGMRDAVKEEANRIGLDPSAVTDEFIESFLRDTEQAVNPQAAALRGEEEFGIGLTEGQRTGSQKQIRFENRARAGDFGEKAQNFILKKEAEQQQQARAATQQVQGRFGDPLASQTEAGQLVRQGVQNAEQAANARVQQAFDEVGDASLSAGNVRNLLDATENAIRGVEFDKRLEATSRVLDDVRKLKRFLERKDIGANVSAFDLKRVNAMRRRLGGSIKTAKDSTDRRQLTLMKQGFDDFLDDAVIKGLFEGDQKALNSLRGANELFREYAKKFRAQDVRTKGGQTAKDAAGAFVDKIVSANPTDSEIMRMLFGANDTFGSRAGEALAKRFKAILGESSPEFQTIRQAAFLRFVHRNDDVINGAMSLRRLNRATKGDQRNLVKTLFSPDELRLFERLFTQIKRTTPEIVQDRANPSGSGTKVLQAMTDSVSRLAQILGATTGNALMFVGGKGVEVGKSFRATARARRAVRPFQRVIDARPEQVSTGVATTMTGTEE